jgi:hypothetical protein
MGRIWASLTWQKDRKSKAHFRVLGTYHETNPNGPYFVGKKKLEMG